MMPVLPVRHLRRLTRQASLVLRRFRKSRSGVAATEFALMVPAMMMIWVGMVVATDALTADKKVTLLTRTLADMTTQMQAVSQADMDSIFQATEAVMWPQPAERLGMRVTSFDIDGASKVFVDWSVTPSNAALRGSFTPLARCSSSTVVPAGLRIARTSIIYAEVTMRYQASVASQVVDQMFKGAASGGEMPLGDRLFMRSRQANKVQFNPAPAGPCPGFVN
ncbi:MAG: pilus assembly protein [Beijerinckiaceae bacterium]|jgi:Flp pilus assembly protein TadG|nr:pilus assembly protein [Beijerinckiaceae bacterium]